MDVQIVFAIVVLMFLFMIIVLTWNTYPYAKYIVMSRVDSENRYIAIQDIEVIDNKGVRKDIIGIEGKGNLISGFANTTSAINSDTTGNTAPIGDIILNGKNMAYFKDFGSVSGKGKAIGPIIAAIPGNEVLNGHIMFSLGCSSKIARINIRAVDDEKSRINLQHVKVYLLNKDKHVIHDAEQIIPFSANIPVAIHHISFR